MTSTPRVAAADRFLVRTPPVLASVGWLVQLEDGTFQPTANRAEATHHHVWTDEGIEVAELAEPKNGLRERVLSSTVILAGAD